MDNEKYQDCGQRARTRFHSLWEELRKRGNRRVSGSRVVDNVAERGVAGEEEVKQGDGYSNNVRGCKGKPKRKGRTRSEWDRAGVEISRWKYFNATGRIPWWQFQRNQSRWPFAVVTVLFRCCTGVGRVPRTPLAASEISVLRFVPRYRSPLHAPRRPPPCFDQRSSGKRTPCRGPLCGCLKGYVAGSPVSATRFTGHEINIKICAELARAAGTKFISTSLSARNPLYRKQYSLCRVQYRLNTFLRQKTRVTALCAPGPFRDAEYMLRCRCSDSDCASVQQFSWRAEGSWSYRA